MFALLVKNLTPHFPPSMSNWLACTRPGSCWISTDERSPYMMMSGGSCCRCWKSTGGTQRTRCETVNVCKSWGIPVNLHLFWPQSLFSIKCSRTYDSVRGRLWSCSLLWVTCRSTFLKKENKFAGFMQKTTGWRSGVWAVDVETFWCFMLKCIILGLYTTHLIFAVVQRVGGQEENPRPSCFGGFWCRRDDIFPPGTSPQGFYSFQHTKIIYYPQLLEAFPPECSFVVCLYISMWCECWLRREINFINPLSYAHK